MLTINRIKVEIETIEGKYGFDEVFTNGLNFIVSKKNTSGKSSILLAIYYALGLEQLIGGHGSRILSRAYKEKIKDASKEYNVLESGIYLEISNGNKVNTIYRSGKNENRESKLITVYDGDTTEAFNNSCSKKDYYVNMQNAATNEYGFHHYLEEYLNLHLPMVFHQEGKQRKLYLQLIFSALFIEQKRGWADFYSAMPNLGVKDPKKRVPEYILGLEKLALSKKRNELKNIKLNIENEWNLISKNILSLARKENFIAIDIPLKPTILDDSFVENMTLVYQNNNNKTTQDIIHEFSEEIKVLTTLKPKIVDNFTELENELSETESDIEKIQEKRVLLIRNRTVEQHKINSLEYNIQIIDNDLQTNSDAKKLKKLGTTIGIKVMDGQCPLCNQVIDDNLLQVDENYHSMSIEDNIKHLKAQKNALEYTLNNHQNNLSEIKEDMEKVNKSISSLRRIAKMLRNDLYKIDDDISESQIYKRIDLQNKIDNISLLQENFEDEKVKFKPLSEQWRVYLEDSSNLPKGDFTEEDSKKLNIFKVNFIKNLDAFGFKSDLEYKKLNISETTYLPEIEGFDMKFDSSASDHIRTIWAFTLALLQTSLSKNGNHPGIIIFDEPAQHSIVPKDLVALFKTIQSIKEKSQTFLAITMNSSEVSDVLKNFEKDSNVIYLDDLAFKKLV